MATPSPARANCEVAGDPYVHTGGLALRHCRPHAPSPLPPLRCAAPHFGAQCSNSRRSSTSRFDLPSPVSFFGRPQLLQALPRFAFWMVAFWMVAVAVASAPRIQLRPWKHWPQTRKTCPGLNSLKPEAAAARASLSLAVQLKGWKSWAGKKCRGLLTNGVPNLQGGKVPPEVIIWDCLVDAPATSLRWGDMHPAIKSCIRFGVQRTAVAAGDSFRPKQLHRSSWQAGESSRAVFSPDHSFPCPFHKFHLLFSAGKQGLSAFGGVEMSQGWANRLG